MIVAIIFVAFFLFIFFGSLASGAKNANAYKKSNNSSGNYDDFFSNGSGGQSKSVADYKAAKFGTPTQKPKASGISSFYGNLSANRAETPSETAERPHPHATQRVTDRLEPRVTGGSMKDPASEGCQEHNDVRVVSDTEAYKVDEHVYKVDENAYEKTDDGDDEVFTDEELKKIVVFGDILASPRTKRRR